MTTGGQYLHLEEHIAQKKAVYERYRDGLKGLPVKMNPITDGTEPNYWLSAMIIDEEAMCKQVRGEHDALYIKESGKTCPTEILEAIASINAEGRPIWKPMHKKMEAMSCYASQIKEYPNPRSNDGIKALAMYRGSTVSVHYRCLSR